MESHAPPNLFHENKSSDIRYDVRPRDDFSKSPVAIGAVNIIQIQGQNLTDSCDVSDSSLKIPAMYRVLDLIREQASGGLVDKILIAQEGLQRLVNDLKPGAYASLTKVDFKALDELSLRPIGVYGDKEELARLLLSLGVLDEKTHAVVICSQDDGNTPGLRSGIYIVRPSPSSDIVYAIYWPEDSTWMDHASTTQIRNRVTFMRYLTKISEQIICLMSPAQANNFVWNHQEPSDDESDDFGGEFGDDDRLFTFEVTKTNEQEESVVARPGFDTSSKLTLKSSETHEMDLFPPRLISGEVTQGFLSVRLIPPSTVSRHYGRSLNDIQLRALIMTSGLRIQCHLSEEELFALAKAGLQEKYPEAWKGWLERKNEIAKDTESLRQSEYQKKTAQLKETELLFGRQVCGYLVSLVLEQFPSLDPLRLSGTEMIAFGEVKKLREDFEPFLASCRTLPGPSLPALREFANGIGKIDSENFREQKKRTICAQIIRKNDTNRVHDDIIKKVIAGGVPNDTDKLPKQEKGGILSSLISVVQSLTSTPAQSSPVPPDAKEIRTMVNRHCRGLSDVQFIKDIPSYLQDNPLIEPATREALRDTLDFFASRILKAFGSLMPQCIEARHRLCQIQIARAVTEKQNTALHLSEQTLFAQIEASQADFRQNLTVTGFSLRVPVYSWQRSIEYVLTGTDEIITPQSLEYQINRMQISSDEQACLQLDHSFIPSPSVVQKDCPKFHLSPGHCIVHAQLLNRDRLLLVIDDKRDNFFIYLEPLHTINAAIVNQGSKRKLNQRKIGRDILIAYNEDKRILVLCSTSKINLHVMVFDETFSILQPWANPFDLSSWYAGESVHVCQMAFVVGTEEVLLIDSECQARIFSLVSQRFRPASVSLPEMPISSFSSPDGACALFLFRLQDRPLLTAHHWDSFGAAGGITLKLDEIELSTNFTVTSFVNRQSVHLMSLDYQRGRCQSVALDITKKSSELMFKERGTRISHDALRQGQHLNNCMVDCFSDVWFRFPVVPAIGRDTVYSSASQRRRRITFISENTEHPFASYFADMVRLFEDQTKKPTGEHLKSVHVTARTFQDLLEDVGSVDWSDEISCFNTGEWLVGLLCLIPIQIAVMRENRFVPLKNGVTSAEFERSLLGAEVGRIVDSLSFGWYESILSSYMADKPVRVVSSMGEQSVGKSFALNHLVDTSFAGSAMRTTEGVWMSITPTNDALLVALDFEGVHSIERSPQEDALLVLFNTAISNLVLFRNNFALSRDITNLFQSFQASSVILDPAANPSLFQSTLVIIIKDVVDSDKREVVREFSLKFQKIVAEEQTANFISKLHAGKLDIIPWPVIESDKFYAYFSALKRRLYSQAITHPSAGEFLHTLKILMAKLKTNDWGAMSQTVASHRAQTLLTILPVALEYGKAAIYPDFEPLKNMDNGMVIDNGDHGYRLFISTSSIPVGNDRETILFELGKTWEGYGERHRMDEETWFSQLTKYLSDVVDVRALHVEAWISANLSRFKAANTSVDALQREMANAVIDLRANVEICRMSCSECHLLCTLSRRHDPLQPHSCRTDHRCPLACEFTEEHPHESKPCHSRAGHDGPHICHVEDHLCGQPCVNQEKRGCQGPCTQMIGHSGSHICSARKHACGKPCQLRIFSTDKTLRYSCPGTCTYPSDEEHIEHICDQRECPMTCDLCKRLCTNTHLHGLDPEARHLCGEAHRCNALCTSGICEIDTTPQSIDATFTGRHETFQYTKYTQVAKKLPCVKPIPVGKHAHAGEHIHSLDPSPFHFCDARCQNCGYYCTLPRGHPQQEHETSHGSMSRTKWAIDGPEDSVMEVDGRKFAANDEGAPMMCNLVCKSLSCHAHIDFCLTTDLSGQGCRGPEHHHIGTRLAPSPERPKDWITHALYWRRSGFRDPYSREDQASFSKCDVMCPGPEHTATQPAQPSYCTLPLFHAPRPNNQLAELGWISNDGHVFSCKNPVVMQQAFHVIFVIDRSGSMRSSDHVALPATPVTRRISSQHNNRLGAVYLSLHAFWDSRQVALTGSGTSQSPARRDGYSVLLFNGGVSLCIENDFQKTPDQLLEQILPHRANGGTNYTTAVRETEAVMTRNWSGERSPVVIFLSDGDCTISDGTVENLCRTSIALGKPLSFHTVSFGPRNEVLRRMAMIAREIERTAPRDSLIPAAAHAESSYVEALDSVRLAETFLGLADSLKKTRGALMS